MYRRCGSCFSQPKIAVILSSKYEFESSKLKVPQSGSLKHTFFMSSNIMSNIPLHIIWWGKHTSHIHLATQYYIGVLPEVTQARADVCKKEEHVCKKKSTIMCDNDHTLNCYCNRVFLLFAHSTRGVIILYISCYRSTKPSLYTFFSFFLFFIYTYSNSWFIPQALCLLAGCLIRTALSIMVDGVMCMSLYTLQWYSLSRR